MIEAVIRIVPFQTYGFQPGVVEKDVFYGLYFTGIFLNYNTGGKTRVKNIRS